MVEHEDIGFIPELMTAYYGPEASPYSIRDQIVGEPTAAGSGPPDNQPPAGSALPAPESSDDDETLPDPEPGAASTSHDSAEPVDALQ